MKLPYPNPETAGQVLCNAVREAFGIDARWIFRMEADAYEVTIWRGIEDSEGRLAVAPCDENGDLVPAMVVSTHSLRGLIPGSTTQA